MLYNKYNDDLQLPVLRLMCIFSVFVLVIDIGDLLMNQEFRDFILETLHVLQIITVCIFLKKYKISLKELYLFKNKFSFRIAFISVIISFLLMFIDPLIGAFISLPTAPVEESGFASTVFMLIFAGFIAPVFEEIEFRALLFRSLHKSHSFIYALFMSSFMFFVIHTGYFNWGALGLGIISVLMLLWTDNLIYSTIIHFINNFTISALAFISFFIPNDNNDSIDYEVVEKAGTFETIASLSVFIIILVLLMMYVYKLTRENSECDSSHNTHNNSIAAKRNPKAIFYYIFYFSICIGSTIMQVVFKTK